MPSGARNMPSMGSEMTPNDPKWAQKCPQMGPETIPKWLQNAPKWTGELAEMDPGMDPQIRGSEILETGCGESEDRPETLDRWSKI